MPERGANFAIEGLKINMAYFLPKSARKYEIIKHSAVDSHEMVFHLKFLTKIKLP